MIADKWDGMGPPEILDNEKEEANFVCIPHEGVHTQNVAAVVYHDEADRSLDDPYTYNHF